MQILFNRRSVRTFTEQAVEPEKLDRILRAAMQAPSAGNQQPWEFIVYTKRETLDQLAETTPYTRLIKNAPMAILLLGKKKGLKYPQFWEQDMGACMQNLMLQAAALELGTCWMGIPLDKTEVIDKLHTQYQIPEEYNPFGLVAVGYPAKENANRFIDRFDASRIHHELF